MMFQLLSPRSSCGLFFFALCLLSSISMVFSETHEKLSLRNIEDLLDTVNTETGQEDEPPRDVDSAVQAFRCSDETCVDYEPDYPYCQECLDGNITCAPSPTETCCGLLPNGTFVVCANNAECEGFKTYGYCTGSPSGWTEYGNWCGAEHGGLGPSNDCKVDIDTHPECEEPEPYRSYDLNQLLRCTGACAPEDALDMWCAIHDACCSVLPMSDTLIPYAWCYCNCLFLRMIWRTPGLWNTSGYFMYGLKEFFENRDCYVAGKHGPELVGVSETRGDQPRIWEFCDLAEVKAETRNNGTVFNTLHKKLFSWAK